MRMHRGSTSVIGAICLAGGLVVTDAPHAHAAVAAATPANLQALRTCESGGDYRKSTGNGYYGAYQFSPTTWRSLGYTGMPHLAAPETQDQAAVRLQARDGWLPWPACTRKLGLR